MRDVLLILIVLAVTALFCIVAATAQPAYRYGTYLPLVVSSCEVRDAWSNTCYSFWPR